MKKISSLFHINLIEYGDTRDKQGNYAKFLKNLHSEQIAKLITKNQHECDLLEDIRTFTIKRCAIERSYSEALLKISSAYLNKKIPNIPDIKLDGGEEKWNMWNVWRTVLEENEKLARARLAAVEVFQQQIADDSKMLRSHKVSMTKKCVDHLAIVQKELQTCVQEVDKTKKLYFDEEHSAHDVRDKARDLEEKLKKKKGSFFQSITSLQKNSAKFSNKRDQLEEKSSGARNDYLLCLAAANAHQNRYFVVDLQLAMSTMESSVFDKVAEYLMLMGRTELLTCSAMQNSFTVIRDQAKQLTREYNLQCCYLYYPVLKQHIQYEFEPCDNDAMDHISAEHESAAATLSKEARRWATKIARENNNIRDSVRKLQIFNALRESGQRVDPNDQNGPDLETKIEEMKQSIRRSETSKLKAEARIEYLRIGDVNVDEWLQEAETLNVQDIQRSASSLSDHPSSDSFYDSDFAEGEGAGGGGNAPTVIVASATSSAVSASAEVKVERDIDDDDDSQDMDAILEQERNRIEQLTAEWDDPTQVDWSNEESGQVDGIQDRTPSGPVLKCTAIYSYTAQNPDELSILENEQLEVVGEGDGDGWLRARNYRGEEGYVPHNYLDVEGDIMTPSGSTTGSVGNGGLANQISFSSVDYTVDNEDNGLTEHMSMSDAQQSPDQVSVIAAPSAAIQEPLEIVLPPSVVESHSTTSGGQEWCTALYDYDGEGDEELTFDEGQLIRIITKLAHGVDDGWWRGEVVDTGRMGNFPSLVVEVCDEYGEALSGGSDDEPPASAPPVFTPPDIPEGATDGFEDGFGDGDVMFEDEDEDIQAPTPPAEKDDADMDGGPPPPSEPPPSMPPPPLPPSVAPAPVISNCMSTNKCNKGVAKAPSEPPPKPPPASKSKGGFNMELSRGQQEQYGQQFSDVMIDEEKESIDQQKPRPPVMPAIGIPCVIIDDENAQDLDVTEGDTDEFGLGFAQIVITAATPMIEEPEQPFPPHKNELNEDEALEVNSVDSSASQIDQDQENINDEIERTKVSRTISNDELEEQPTDSAPFPISSSSEGETTGPSTAENSVSHAPPQITLAEDAITSSSPDARASSPPEPPMDDPPKQVVGGRASIPDELEPHQLARLQDLKESNA